MTTTGMAERRQRVEELVAQDEMVIYYGYKFSDAQTDITRWHVESDTAVNASIEQLEELEGLIVYSKRCLEELKQAKSNAYENVMREYPHVWDTTCPNPFDTSAQDTDGETCDTDGDGREERLKKALKTIADCMNVPVENVRITCTGVLHAHVSDSTEPTQDKTAGA